MNKIFIFVILLILTGCESSTALGPCVGIFGEQDKSLVYKTSVRNLVIAVFAVELNEFSCPVSKND